MRTTTEDPVKNATVPSSEPHTGVKVTDPEACHCGIKAGIDDDTNTDAE
jgi:hypothetical protein